MSLKAKIILGVAALILALAIVAIVVWAVNRTSYSLTGTIKFEDTNVHAQVSGEFVGMDSNLTLPTLIFSECDDASSQEDIDKWADTALSFASLNTPIQVEITVENLSEKLLYVKIDDRAGEIANLTKSVVSSSQDALGKYLEIPGYSSIIYTITLSLIEQSKGVDGECEYLITLVDQTEEETGVQIQALSNMESLGAVSGGGEYNLGDVITLSATPSNSDFLVWATSTDPETMKIVSVSPTYSFELTEDSPTTYYALFNSTTITYQEIGDLIYTFYNEAKLASVTDAESSISGDFTIPSVVTSESNEKYKIYSIGERAFMMCYSLTSIIIPEGVTSIEDNAFNVCTSLTKITFPKELVSIAQGAFASCDSLTTFEGEGNDYYSITEDGKAILINGGTTFLYYASGNTETSYTVPEGIVTISENAFLGSILTSITISSTVKVFENNSFSNFFSLESIVFAEGSQLTTIGEMAFFNTTKLLSIILPSNVTEICDSAFQWCRGLTSVTLPEGLISIGEMAFKNCLKLKQITIPSTVTSIGISAFDSAIEFFYGEGNDYYTIDDNRALIVDGGKTFVAYAASNPATSYVVPEGIITIGRDAFDGSDLTQITLPSTLKTIELNAFHYCQDISSIILPEGLTSIGSSAFSNCSALTSITIPESVTSISSQAFSDCTNLAEVKIGGNPDLVMDIFYNCLNLSKISLGANVESSIVYTRIFEKLDSLTTIIIEEGSSFSAELPSFRTWEKDGQVVTSFSGAGTYTRTDI